MYKENESPQFPSHLYPGGGGLRLWGGRIIILDNVLTAELVPSKLNPDSQFCALTRLPEDTSVAISNPMRTWQVPLQVKGVIHVTDGRQCGIELGRDLV